MSSHPSFAGSIPKTILSNLPPVPWLQPVVEWLNSNKIPYQVGWQMKDGVCTLNLFQGPTQVGSVGLNYGSPGGYVSFPWKCGCLYFGHTSVTTADQAIKIIAKKYKV